MSHVGHLGHEPGLSIYPFCSHFQKMFHMKFGLDWPIGVRGDDIIDMPIASGQGLKTHFRDLFH